MLIQKRFLCLVIICSFIIGMLFVAKAETLHNVAYRIVPVVTGSVAVQSDPQKQEWRMVNGYKGTTSGHDFYQTLNTPADTPVQIVFDLEDEHPVEKVAVCGGNSTRPTDFDVSLSLDGETWELFGRQTSAGGGYFESVITNTAIIARYVKIDVTKSTADMAISEIEIFSQKRPKQNVAYGKTAFIEGAVTNSENTPDKAVNGVSSLIASNTDVNLVVDQAQTMSAASDGWKYVVELGNRYLVNKIVMVPGKSAYPSSYDIEVSNDNQNWIPVASQANGKGSFVPVTYYFNPISAKYVRVNVFSSNSANPGISELEVYEAAKPRDDNPPVFLGQDIFVYKNTSLSKKLNVSDENMTTLSYEVKQAPAHGHVELVGDLFTYTPDVDYTGNDYFVIDAADEYLNITACGVNVLVRDSLPIQIQNVSLSAGALDFDYIVDGQMTVSYDVSNSTANAETLKVNGLLVDKTTREVVDSFENTHTISATTTIYDQTASIEITDCLSQELLIYCGMSDLTQISDAYTADNMKLEIWPFLDNMTSVTAQAVDGIVAINYQPDGHSVLLVANRTGEIELAAIADSGKWTFPMPAHIPSGDYDVFSGICTNFYYSDKTLRHAAVAAVNQPGSNLLGIIDQYKKTIPVDWDFIKQGLTSAQLEQMKLGNSYQNTSQIAVDIDSFFTIKQFCKLSESDAITFLNQKALQLNISLEGDYEIYKSEIVKKIIANEANSVESFVIQFNEITALVAFNRADRSTIEAVIERYGDILILPEAYENLSDENKKLVLKALVNHADFTDLAGLRSTVSVEAEKLIGTSGFKGTGMPLGGTAGGQKATVFTNESVPIDRPEPVQHKSFDDLEAVPWASEAIEYLFNKGIVDGTGENKFSPNDCVTREQFTKMLILAFSGVDESAACYFGDVFHEDWSYPYIATAFSKKLINGMDEKEFQPKEWITRQDMAVLVYRFGRYVNLISKSGRLDFDDKDDIGDYAKEAVASLASGGIINGVGVNMFSPHSNCTRAMAAKVIYEVILKGGGNE